MTLRFSEVGDFAALYAAQAWCRNAGYSYGSTDITGRVALMRGDVLIAKWHNLSAKERAECDGVMTGDFRNGPVTINIKD